MLQRTRATQVEPVFRRFRDRYPTPEALARESEAGLLKTTGSLGLRWRAPLMIKMAQAVAEHGRVPDEYGALTQLPGVGPYAASAFLSLHRDVRAPIVDANVVRMVGRILGIETDAETRRKAWLLEAVERLTPKKSFRDFNYALLDLSMTVCRSKPACPSCPLAPKLCAYAAERKTARP